MATRTYPIAARLAASAIISLISFAFTTGPLRPVNARASGTFLVGMYNTGTPWSFTSLDALETQLGVHMQIVHWYQSWGSASVNAADFDPSLLSATSAHGSIPFITWEPWDTTLPVDQTTFPLTSITNGEFDSYIDSWAAGLKAYGQPVLLTFAQEMQGNWYPWGYGVNGNTASDYVNAYRHVHDRVVADGATNVEWVWTVDADQSGSPYPAATDFYPGEAYTDWMGVDVYNWGTTQTWSSWQSLSEALSLTYQELTRLNSTKPLILSEWASVEAGGSKAQWILDAASALQQSFPRVQAAVWFNEHNTGWALDSSTTALGAAAQTLRQLAGGPACPQPGWEPLGGILSSGPAAASWSSNRLDVFVRGADNALWHKWWDGTRWSGWESLGGVLRSAPAAVSWGPNRLDVFVRGADNALWHRWWDGNAWYGWEPLGGVLSAGPAVAAWGPNRLDVFVRGSDLQLWHKWWDGSAWNRWEPLGGVLASDPTAASWGTGRIDVFVQGTDSALWHQAWNGANWSGWQPLGGSLASSPASAALGTGQLQLFARAPDGSLSERWLNGSWGGWQPEGGALNSGPGATSRSSSQSDVFVRGTDNALWHALIKAC